MQIWYRDGKSLYWLIVLDIIDFLMLTKSCYLPLWHRLYGLSAIMPWIVPPVSGNSPSTDDLHEMHSYCQNNGNVIEGSNTRNGVENFSLPDGSIQLAKIRSCQPGKLVAGMISR